MWSVVTSTLVGSLTRTSESALPKLPLIGGGTSTKTITPNLVLVVDAQAGTTTLDGGVGVSTGTIGAWSVNFDGVVFGSGQVRSGTIFAQRTSFPSLGASFTFDSPDAGTLTLTPGITLGFTL